MAGIGYELRKLLRVESFSGLIKGYGYAGLIGSGPWFFSIVGVLMIGLLRTGGAARDNRGGAFLVVVTWMMAASLILTGLVQLFLSRFVADRTFEKRVDAILPNLMGALAVTTMASGLLGTVAIFALFDEPLLLKQLLLACFVVVCDQWLLVVMLSGLKEYRWVLAIFILGYALSVVLALSLQRYSLEGLLAGFLVGQVGMLLAFLALVRRGHPTNQLISFEFLTRKKAPWDLVFTGFFYNLGIWVDKLLFWLEPGTSERVIGPLRSSLIYDLPMFLAYLSIIPGMAVFLVRIETDFAEWYSIFYEGVRSGESFGELMRLKGKMVESIRQGVYEVFKVQGLAMLLLILGGPRLMALLGFSTLHLPLYNVDLVGIGGQVLVLAVLNVYFYLDQRLTALGLSALLLVANATFTFISQRLGPPFYGYGFVTAIFLTGAVGLVLLSRKLERLEYETFMLQT